MRNDVKELRLAAEISQKKLAQEMGVTRQTIISIENGKYVPLLELAMKLSARFGKTVEEVFHRDPEA